MTDTPARSNPQGISVFVIDNSPPFLDAAKRMLLDADWIKQVSVTALKFDVIQRAAAAQPDVVVVDFGLRVGEAADFIRRLRAAVLAARVLVLSLDPDEPARLAALEAGADGFLAKEATPEMLLPAIRELVGRG